MNEESFVALMAHLAENGSDGFVVAGTTGEASTLTDEEQLGLIDLAVKERPAGTTIIAGAGTNDTRHAVHLTERATELGADAVLSVTPYYNRPSPLGLKRHYEAVAKATDKPILLYNIPKRTGTNIAPDLLAELAQIEHIDGVKQANPDGAAADRRPRRCTPATTRRSRARWTWAAPAGSSSPATSSVASSGGWWTSPSIAQEIDASLRDVYETLFLTASPTCTKAALNLLGHDAGGVRLPIVEATDGGDSRRSGRCWNATACSARTRRPHPAASTRVSSTLRVLPLGGLGEIGKNMTVSSRTAGSSWSTSGCASRPRRWSASTSCCPTSPTCASARRTSRRS